MDQGDFHSPEAQVGTAGSKDQDGDLADRGDDGAIEDDGEAGEKTS